MVLAKPKSRRQPAKPGLYNAMVNKVTDNKDGSVTVQMSLFGKGFTYTENYTMRPMPIETNLLDDMRTTDPNKGLNKFFVLSDKFAVYTSIGADNRHHAANKATKLFGPNWTQVRQDHNGGVGYTFISVIEFRELLKTLPN